MFFCEKSTIFAKNKFAMLKSWHKKVLNWLMVLVPLALLIIVVSCSKKNKVEPEPEPYDVVIDWNWEDNLGWAPPANLIKEYAQNKYVNNIFINLTSPNSTGMMIQNFRRARDSLQTRIDVAPTRVRGMGTIFVNRTGGAQLPDTAIYTAGMALSDSIWFTDHGWMVQRLPLIR